MSIAEARLDVSVSQGIEKKEAMKLVAKDSRWEGGVSDLFG